jgi:hypothetical protein
VPAAQFGELVLDLLVVVRRRDRVGFPCIVAVGGVELPRQFTPAGVVGGLRQLLALSTPNGTIGSGEKKIQSSMNS